ncbi:hypothetical protein [Streptomyces sp. GbtcB6]|uniref:hypothetical protein n=1 Tax=Streptomyces sp. GbtcB6 TaxID=2824751 RepID=UPI001C2F6D98|nr:hypothetical protein [Streptomyces sp. GbtcB6]
MSVDILTKSFQQVNWDQMEEVHIAATNSLTALADPAQLGLLWDRMEKDDRLAASAEAFNTFQKYVLYEDPETGLRLRLHIFGDHAVEEAHNHRASFSSLILHGSYRHILYGNVEDVWGEEDRLASAPEARFVQEQPPGSCYTVHNAFVHAVYANPDTISLVIQGPRQRKSIRIYEFNQGTTRTRVGGSKAGEVQEPGERKIGRAELRTVRDRLAGLGLLL